MAKIIDYIGSKIRKYQIGIVGGIAGIALGLSLGNIGSSSEPGPIDDRTKGARPASAVPPSSDYNGDKINDLVITGRDGHKTILYGTKKGNYVPGSVLNKEAAVPIDYGTIEARLNGNKGE